MRYKNIPSAARNVAESFLSDNNFVPGDSIASLLARRAVATHEPIAEIDLLSGEGSPTVLTKSPVAESIKAYANRFRQVFQDQNLDPERVKIARLQLAFVLDRVSASVGFPDSSEVPVDCSALVVDDRGKEHDVVFRKWILFFNHDAENRPVHHRSSDHMR